MKTSITTSPKALQIIGRKLYSNHPLIIVTRELLQNAIDAVNSVKSRENYVHITIQKLEDEKYCIICDDNGIGMSQDILINKFLSLGESGKRDSLDNTGGFGVAKCAIFSCDFWEVHTRDLYISSDNLGGDLVKRKKRIGTMVKCIIDESTYFSTLKNALSMIYLSDVKIHLTYLDGDNMIFDDKNAGLKTEKNLHSDLGDFKISLVENFEENYQNFAKGIYYRVNGLVQFRESLYNLDSNVIVDVNPHGYLPTDNSYPFSMSREEIKRELKNQIDGIIGKFEIDSKSTKWQAKRKNNNSSKEKISQGVLIEKTDKIENLPAVGKMKTVTEFTSGKKTKITTDHKRILRLYSAILSLVAREESFMVGITDDSVDGMRGHFDGEICYYIKPSNYIDKIISNFWNADCLIHAIHDLAVHESSHCRFSSHNEEFTSEEHSLNEQSIKKLLDNMPELRKIIRNMEVFNYLEN